MGKNDKTNIQHPEAWELLVAIGDQQLDYILYAPAVAGSLQMGHASRTDDSLQALEDATYDTPDLLNDYKRVRVVVHSQHFVLLPMETSDEDCAELLDDSSELWGGTASEDGGSTPLDAGPDEDDAVGFSMELEDAEDVSEESMSSSSVFFLAARYSAASSGTSSMSSPTSTLSGALRKSISYMTGTI